VGLPKTPRTRSWRSTTPRTSRPQGRSGRPLPSCSRPRCCTAPSAASTADDLVNPDWRVISARGTGLAKQGIYRGAIAFYQRALALAPNEASILNYLALAHAILGEVDMAEPLLKRAAAAGGQAKLAAARDLPPDKAAAAGDGARPQSAAERSLPQTTTRAKRPALPPSRKARKAHTPRTTAPTPTSARLTPLPAGPQRWPARGTMPSLGSSPGP